MDVDDMMAAREYPGTSETRLEEIGSRHTWRQELDNFVDRIHAFTIASFYETALTARLKRVRGISIISYSCYLLIVTAT